MELLGGSAKIYLPYDKGKCDEMLNKTLKLRYEREDLAKSVAVT